MPNKLFLRPELPTPQADNAFDQPMFKKAVFEWALYDLSGQKVKVGNPETIDAIDQTLMQNGISHTEMIVFWPTHAAHSGAVILPGNQTRFLQQVLPFAVEELIAQDIEDVHIAHGAKNKDGQFPVVTVDRALFGACFEALTDQGIDHPLNAIYLDAQMLPPGEQEMHICIAERHILIRNNDPVAISITHDNLFPYLDTVFNQQHAEQYQDELNADFKIKIYTLASQQEKSQMLLAQIAQYPGVQIDSEIMEISDFELLCESFFHHASPKHKLPVNLCQGEFKNVSEASGLWNRWKSVAVIAGLGFLLQLGVFVSKGVWYEKQAAEIAQAALSEYKKAVPGSKNVSVAKLPRIIKGKLNQKNQHQNSEVGFLGLLGETGYQFRQARDKTKLEFKSLNYNRQRGELLIEMRANSFEQLDKLKQAILAAGLTAKISSAVQEEDHFRGRISVSGS